MWYFRCLIESMKFIFWIPIILSPRTAAETVDYRWRSFRDNIHRNVPLKLTVHSYDLQKYAYIFAYSNSFISGQQNCCKRKKKTGSGIRNRVEWNQLIVYVIFTKSCSTRFTASLVESFRKTDSNTVCSICDSGSVRKLHKILNWRLSTNGFFFQHGTI